MKRSTATTHSWAWLRKLFRPYRTKIILLCAGTAVQSLLQVVVAALTRDVIDYGTAGASAFPMWGALLLLTLALTAALKGGIAWLSGSLSDHTTAALRHDLLDAAEHAVFEDFRAYHSGVLVNRSTADVRTVCGGATEILPTLVGHLMRLAASFAAIALLCPPAAALLALIGLAAGCGAAFLRPVLKRGRNEVRRADEQAVSSLQENLQQRELLQALGAETEALRLYDALLQKGLEAKRRRRKLSVGSGAALSTAVQMGSGLLLLWGAAAIHGGTLSFGTLAAMLQLLSLFRGPVLGLSGLWTKLTAVEVSGARLREVLELPREAPASAPIPTRADAVVFENVTFRYQPEEDPVLEGFGARFDLTDWTCLTGLSGRGKTTMFRLILGLSRPQKGRAYLETDCGEVECGAATRRLIAYVPQNYALFSGTILENLRLAAPSASLEQCRRALEIAQADFVWSLPKRELSQVRERNSGLSICLLYTSDAADE